MDSGSMVYFISPAEMARRRKAYTTLIAGLFLGAAAAAFDLLISYPMISMCALACLALLLVFSRLYFFRIFRKMERMRLFLGTDHIEIVAGESSKRYRLDAVAGVWIKRTARETIREIRIRLDHRRQIAITGLQDFEAFNKNLQERIREDAPVSECTESMDFDHPLFYAFFGFFSGGVATGIIRLVTIAGNDVLKWIQTGISCFLFLTGIYWILHRPLSRYAIGTPFMDYIFGLLLLLLGIAGAACAFIDVP